MKIVSRPLVADLLAGDTMAARLDRLHAEGIASIEGLAWVLDVAEDLVHLNPAEADGLATLCAAAAERLGLPAVAGRASYVIARVLAERGDLEKALERIRDAHESWLAAGNQLAAARTNLGRMGVLDDLGRHAESASVGEDLLGFLDGLAVEEEERELRELVRGTALNNLGVAYSFVGEHERALAAYAEAEQTYRRLGQSAEIAKPLANRGIELLALGRSREALVALTEATDLFESAGDRLWAAKCSGNVATAHQQLGELTEALRLLEPARATLADLGAEMESLRLRQAEAEVYLAAGLYHEAQDEAAAVAVATTSAGMDHDAGRARFTSALAFLLAGDPESAAHQLDIARGLFESVGDRQHLARLLLAEVDIAAASGRPVHAKTLAASAVAALRQGGWRVPMAWATLRQVDLAMDEEAVDDVACDLRLREAADLVHELDLPPLRYAYLLRLGERRRGQGCEAEAEQALREAAALAEEMGVALPDQALRVAFRADKTAAHDQLVDLLVTRGTPQASEEACRIGDRAKAQTLVDIVTGTLGSGTPSGPAGLEDDRGDLARLRADLSACYGALLTAEGSTRRDLVLERSRSLEREITKVRLRAVAASGSRDARGWLASLTSQELPPGADPRLSFHVVGRDVIAFVTADGRVEARRLVGAAPRIRVELDRLAAQWSRFSMGAALLRRHGDVLLETAMDILGALYRLLIEPVTDLLGPLDGRTLTVVPHRRLHQVPFHALYDGSRFLAERWATTLTSATPRLGHGPMPLGRRPVARLLGLGIDDAGIPMVAEELRAVAATVGDARIVVGEAATSRYLTEQLPGPDVLHIASHGFHHPDNPLFSSIRLADRWFTSAEILELDLGGALVTLSACESGTHNTDQAEPVGLAWAFLAAGASSVVVSQWVVDDKAASGLMPAFYRQVADDIPVPEALRRAQLATLAKNPHPYYWGAFAHVSSPIIREWREQ